MTSVNTSASAMDFAQIAQLKSNAKTDEAGSVKEVAQQFESIFINMMLQSMRKATERSGLMDSDAAQTYEAMFDQELALHLSEQGGFGVAEALERQIQMNQSRTRVAAPLSALACTCASRPHRSRCDQITEAAAACYIYRCLL